MAKNLELNIVLGAAVANAINGMNQVANALKNTTKSVKEFEKQIKNMEKAQKAFQNMDKAREGLNKINSEYKKAAEHLQKLKAEYERTGSSNKQLAKEIEQAEKSVGKLNKQKERQQHVFEAARSKIEAEGASLSNYRSKVQEVEKEIEKMNKLKEAQKRYDARQETVGKMKDFGDKQIMQGMGMAGALAVPIKIAMDLEEAQADLKKVAKFGSKEMETGFYKAMRNFSESNPISQKELFQIAGAGAQAGIKTDELERYTKDAAKIKVAFDMNTEAAGNFLAKTRAQFGIGQKEVMDYADVINYLANNVAVTAPELVNVSQEVGGLGGIAGISKESVMALGATLVASGVDAKVAATGLKNFSLGLTAGESATNRQKAAFESLGLSAGQVAKDMQANADKTILNVLSKIKQLPAHLRAATLKDLFGKESIQSVTELMNHLDDLGVTLTNVHDKTKTAGSVNTEYNERIKTLKSNLETLRNTIVNVGVDLGNALAPSLIRVAAQIKPVVKNFANWIQKHPQLTANILKSVAALAAFKIGIGGLAKGFAPLFSGISKGILIFDKFKAAGSFAGGLKAAFPIVGKLGSATAKLGPMLANPYVAAGAAVVGVLVLMYSKWKWFKNGINNGIKQIMPYFKAIKDTFKSVFGDLTSSASKELGKMKPLFDSLKPVLSVIGTILKVVIIGALIGIKYAVIALGPIFKVVFAAIRIVVMTVFNAIKVIIIGAIAVIKGIVKTLAVVFKVVWTTIKVVATVVWAAICAVIMVAINVIKTIFKPLAPFFKAVWNAIKATGTAVWNAIKSVATILWGALKSGINGAQNFFSTAWNTMKSVALSVWNAIKGAFDIVAGGLKKAIDGVVNYFKEKWAAIKNFASNNPISKGIGGLFGKNAAGTNYWSGGLTTVAERGAELIQMPGKPAFLAEHEMLLNLPRGTQILNNRETKNSFRDKISGLKERMSELRSNESSGSGDVINITINAGGNVDTNMIEKAVMRALEKARNKKERTAFA